MYPSYENKRNELSLRVSKSLRCGKHLHGHVEFVIVLEGETIAAQESTEYRLQAGDAFLAFPNQVHYYDKVGQERSLLAIFPPDFCTDFQDVFLNYLPESPVIRNFLDSDLRAFCETLLELDVSQKYYRARVRGGLTILLARFLEQMPHQRNLRADTDILKSILSYCVQNYASNLCLDELAHTLHVSKFHISHLINGKLKMSFSEYLHSIRISAAMPLLANGDLTVTEISHQVGYNSTRTFNRAFLQQTGITPREYRNSAEKRKQVDRYVSASLPPADALTPNENES